MKRVTGLIMVGAVLLGACGSDGDEPTAESTTSPTENTENERNVLVRVVAEESGFGCTTAVERSGLDIGNNSRITIVDGDGETLGVGTMQASPGAEICDWTASVKNVPDGRSFYKVDAGEEIVTVSNEELTDSGFNVTVFVDVTGQPELIAE